AAAAVLPVLAQRTARLPSSSALDIARVMPRSLNEPVGFWPSHFRYTSMPGRWRPRREARSRGVAPSRSVTSGVPGVTGREGRGSPITPRQAGGAGAAGVARRARAAAGGGRPRGAAPAALLGRRARRRGPPRTAPARRGGPARRAPPAPGGRAWRAAPPPRAWRGVIEENRAYLPVTPG